MFIRRFILLLFFVLQGFAPLLHAHAPVHGVGLHIPGLNVDVMLGIEVAALEVFDHCDAIIDIKQAISQKKLLDAELANNNFSLRTINFLQPFAIAKYVAIARYTMPIIPSIRWSVVTPRAPPL